MFIYFFITVISETNDEDFLVTEISPVITNNLVEKSTQNNIETIFLQDPVTYQSSINNVLKFVDSYFVPFIFLTLIINFIRSMFMSRDIPNMPNMVNPFSNNNKVNKDKVDLIKANISLSSFAGSPEIYQECIEVVSYLKNSTYYIDAGAEIPQRNFIRRTTWNWKNFIS